MGWSLSILPSLDAPPGRAKVVEELDVRLVVLLPLLGHVVLVEDRLDRADRLARPAVHALVRVDVEHPLALVDAVDRALVDAGTVEHVHARQGDDVGHRRLLLATTPGSPPGSVPPPSIPGRPAGCRPRVAGRRSARVEPGHRTPSAPTSVAALESVAARGWRALETESLGDWLLRASGGFTGRANSVLPLGDPGLALGAAVDAAAGLVRGARAGPPRFLSPLPDAQPVDDELARRGWALGDVRCTCSSRRSRRWRRRTRATRRRPPAVRVEAVHGRGVDRGLPLPGRRPADARAGRCWRTATTWASPRCARRRRGAVLAIARGSVDVDTTPGGARLARRHGGRGRPGGTAAGARAAWCCAASRRGRSSAAPPAATCRSRRRTSPRCGCTRGAGFVRHHDYQYRLASHMTRRRPGSRTAS